VTSARRQSGAIAAEARLLIVGDYAEAATSIAVTPTRLAAIGSEVRALNARLPPGTADVRIEEFRGYSATLGAKVVLPTIIVGDRDFWPTRPRRLTINENLREQLIVPMRSPEGSRSV
jgi:hypothetical protein